MTQINDIKIDPKVQKEIPSSKPQTQRNEKKFKSIYEDCSAKKEISEEEEKESIVTISPIDLMSPPKSPCIEITSFKGVQEVEAVFHQMVEAMTILHQEGISETTLVLHSADGSILSGTEITILEYNTAPKDFNIQIKGSPEAVQLFEKHLGELVAAFNAEYRPFKIHRLDIHQTHKRGIGRKKELMQEELTQDDGSALSLG